MYLVYVGGEVVLQLRWFLPSVNCIPWPLYSWDRTRYPLSRRLGEPQSQPGRSGEEKYVLLLPAFEPRTVFFQFEIHMPEINYEGHGRQPISVLWNEVPDCVGLETCSIPQTDLYPAAAGVSVISLESVWKSKPRITYCSFLLCYIRQASSVSAVPMERTAQTRFLAWDGADIATS